jgi:predicted nucleic acid-binding protein
VIYLDTSAFIKLYLTEEGSDAVHDSVVSQQHPLPIWSIVELEFYNALRFKVFLRELKEEDVDRLLATYTQRKRSGQYHVPHLDPVALHESAIELTARTPTIGCRSLDVLHVAAAGLLGVDLFVTGDGRQASLGRGEGLEVKLV